MNEVIIESSPNLQPEYEEPMNISVEHAVGESHDVLPSNQVQNDDPQGETSGRKIFKLIVYIYIKKDKLFFIYLKKYY